MQAKNYDGSFGNVMPLDAKELSVLLSNENVEHVEVFQATEEEFKKRRGSNFTPKKKKRKKRQK